MKRKTWIFLLCGESVMICGLRFLGNLFPEWFSSSMAFPFEPIGRLIQEIRLFGTIGNSLAVFLWLLFSLTPVWILLLRKKAFEDRITRVSCYGLSLIFGVCFWIILDPTCLPGFLGIDLYGTFVTMVASCTAWAAVVAVLVLKIVRLFLKGNMKDLLGYSQKGLVVLSMLFAASAVETVVTGITNFVSQTLSMGDVILILLGSSSAILTTGLNVVILLFLADLLEAQEKAREDVVSCAKKVSKLSCLSLLITTGLTVLTNLVQLVLSGYLQNVQVSINIPVFKLVFVLGILLLAKLIQQNKQLSDDNAMFV